MFLGPLSEFLGRNLIYLGCYALFCILFIPIALAKVTSYASEIYRLLTSAVALEHWHFNRLQASFRLLWCSWHHYHSVCRFRSFSPLAHPDVDVCRGTLADIWTSSKERSIPIAFFSFVAVLGTVSAPLYNGYVDQNLGWRWIQWYLLI